ncbi:nicotinate-nucleotide pyrophosphorylase [Acidimicrobium ferrooxidans DSM 10331]|uniref:Nicotinate-nucleotide pyrophosphorylase [carboxylating] n=1 Tax=Acidimicrobium ferrooxidans (strain DSM 10331 / JCM 15462 / NBRC 103882 / ICP) TaxID=525909 RepID=C7LYT9_ACIFD|nr:carboxylating nicotinate-nucleotide diphosphorylase [Acidimicrobium ferrooxidans]ACU53897.1 nicotinate-nucleotide pyrophosphorylase [Acidimicrobium ferrooxidans DSM 10331]
MTALRASSLERLVALALDEDLGERGDITGSLVPERTVRLELRARDEGVLAGSNTAEVVLRATAARLGAAAPTIEWSAHDADALEPGQLIAELAGSNRVLLAAERTMLNLLTHLSGVATTTARAVAEIADTRCRLRDTRKTLPGMRGLEKAAVRAGGGENHRFSLDDAILLKDNHLAQAPLEHLVAAARQRFGDLPIEVEVDDLDGLEEALALDVPMVLLDNFTLEATRDAVRLNGGRAKLESSGGLRPGRLREVALTGVDYLAVGWITHSAPSLDLGLDWPAS